MQKPGQQKDVQDMTNRRSICMCPALAIALLLPACNMKTTTLLNRNTPVPKDNTVYANRSKFTAALLTVVDTTVVYEEYDTDKKNLARLDPCITCRVYSVYRFYPNGCFNAFYLNRDKPLSVTDFDPLYTGYRGVYYTGNNSTRYDLFAEIDEQQHIGKISGNLVFSGDTLYLEQDEKRGLDKTTYPTRVFLKRKLPPTYFVYKAGW